MHNTCYYNFIRTNIACPLCRKSVIDPKLIEGHYDMEIASTIMPIQYSKKLMKI
jgi:hypothetical protein